jgi:hypothetical protein
MWIADPFPQGSRIGLGRSQLAISYTEMHETNAPDDSLRKIS